MARLEQCIVDAADELGISKDDAEEIAERLKRFRDEQKLQNRLGNIDDDLRKFAVEKADEMRIAAAQKRKHAALNVIARRNADAHIDQLMDEGLNERDSIVALMVGSVRGMGSARKSIGARRMAIESQWLDGMVREIKRERPHLVKLVQRGDEVLMDDVVREMAEIKPNGNRGLTGNKDAEWLSGLLSKYLEMSRLRLNDAGAFIGKIDGYSPQNHDAARVMGAGFKAWKERIRPLLDIQKSFPNLKVGEIDDVLDEVYQNVTTGRDRHVTAKQKGQKTGPANLAKSLGKHRVLHFQDADSWLQYQKEFGTGNVVSAVVGHLHFAARLASTMEVLGPNPQTFLEALLESRRAAIRKSSLPTEQKTKRLEQLESDLDSGHTSRIAMAFAEISGETLVPVNITIAKRAQTVRAIQSMAKLGGATLSAIADLATFPVMMKFQGKSLAESWHDTLMGAIKGRSVAEQSEMGQMISTGFTNILGEMQARYTSEDMIPGGTAAALTKFFKITGLSGWTDRLLSAFTAMTSQHMAIRAGSDWAGVPDQYRHFLRIHGLGEQHWPAIQKLVTKDDAGDQFVIPELARSLDDEVIDQVIADELADVRTRLKGPTLQRRETQLRNRARRDLETDITSLFADEARFGIIHGDDRSRMVSTAGTRPGTALGEAMRFITQFKSFPIAYSTKILGRSFVGGRKVRGGRFARTDVGSIAHILGASMVMGYLAMTAKDIAKNRTPKDPAKKETIIAALLQGGGAGIYGDFLLNRFSRFGNSTLETLAGPTLTTAADALSLMQGLREGETRAADWFRLTLNNTPYVNLWYTRAALDYAIVNQLEEAMSPGIMRRRERRLREDFGQEFIISP
ncbi:MAG: hypothetical protein ACR2QF_07800 [Geminicoccaceae bacterium]